MEGSVNLLLFLLASVLAQFSSPSRNPDQADSGLFIRPQLRHRVWWILWSFPAFLSTCGRNQHLTRKTGTHAEFQSNINRNGCAHQPSRWSLRIITLHLLKKKRAALAFSHFARTALDVKMQHAFPKIHNRFIHTITTTFLSAKSSSDHISGKIFSLCQ